MVTGHHFPVVHRPSGGYYPVEQPFVALVDQLSLALRLKQVVLALELVDLFAFVVFGRSACEEVGFVFAYLEQVPEQVLVVARVIDFSFDLVEAVVLALGVGEHPVTLQLSEVRGVLALGLGDLVAVDRVAGDALDDLRYVLLGVVEAELDGGVARGLVEDAEFLQAVTVREGA